MPNIEESKAKREETMRKLAMMLKKRQDYENYIQTQQQGEIDRIKGERSERAKKWGDPAVKGAATGMSMGGPWGALIGGGIGTLAGQHGAYKQRREEGEKTIPALFETIFDVGGSLPSMEAVGGMAPSAAASIGGYRSRTAGMPTAQQQLAESAPRRQDIMERYYGGAGGTPGDPSAADLWEFEESRKRKGK